jgi:hypothetical protein
MTRPALTLLFILLAAGAARAQSGAPPLPRVAIEEDGSGTVLRLLDASKTTSVPVAARVALELPAPDGVVEARLAALEARRVPVWLAVAAPGAEVDIEPWRMAIGRLLDRRASTVAVLEILLDDQPARVGAFAVQVAATEARARRAQVATGIGGPAMRDAGRRGEYYTTELAPYVDLLVLDALFPGAGEWLRSVDAEARFALSTPRAEGRAGGRPLVDGVLQDLGTPVVIHVWDAAEVTPADLRALSSLGSVLQHEVSALDAGAVDLSLSVAGADVTASLPHRVLFDTETFGTLLLYWGDPRDEPLEIALRVPVEGTPSVIDPVAGRTARAAGYSRDAATERTRARAPLTGRPMLVDFNEGAAPIAEATGVTAERQLTVAEIVSRHQQQQVAQDRLVRSYIADARMRQFFRPTLTDPGYDVVTDNRYYVAHDGIEWEELSFAVNNRRFEDPPPFPLLQPEKVFSLPLQLRFDEGYRYTLVGAERVDGFDCYKVRFEPVRDDPALYRGTVWIDRRTFARVRVQAVQGGLPGMVVSNDETLHYVPVATIDNRPVFLLARLLGRQVVLLAGRNILLEKTVTFGNFRVNDDGFEHARASARESERVMYRETPAGLRHFVKRDGQRVVSDRATERVKAMALGLIVDPSYAFPLPIFGINYIDFSFGNPDTQLALLFGGVLAAGNIQRPQFGSRRLDASVDFFAIAAPSSDRLYAAGGEVESDRVLTWPMSTGVNLGWKATPFQKLTLQYQFRFDAYVRDTTTDEAFAVPSSTVTNGIGGAWEYSRAGYTVTLNGTWFRRSSWKPWGAPAPDGSVASTPRDYAKYSATVSRDFVLDAFQKINVNAAWFGGRDLDRFVKYQFGMFDATRIHGVPASVRFGELAVTRGSYSVNVFDQYRLDLFLDHAWGRDDNRDPGWRRLPGVGAAFNLPAPWNTILRADIGKSWLPDRYGSLGSTALQVMLLKPMR